jgi:YNFM family putative membrane transporter
MRDRSTTSLRPYGQVLAVYLCGLFAFVDLYSMQPLLPLLRRVFRASESEAGFIISASTLGVAASAALLAIFAERLNRKRLIVGSMGALALCTVVTSTVSSLPALGALRVLQGLVTPGIFTITIAYITEEWPAVLVPRVMSLYVAGTLSGGFLGRLCGGLIGARYGWRAVFLTLGVLGFCGMALTQRLLPPALTRPIPGKRSRLGPFLGNLRNPVLLATFAIGFCMLFTMVALFSYITFYLVAPPFGLSTDALSWLFAVYLCGLLATVGAGNVLVRVGLRRGMLAAITLCLTGVALTLVPSLWVVAMGLAVVTSGVFIAQTCANSFLRDAAPGGSRVSAAGMYVCCYYIGGTVGGVLPGIFWNHGGWHACVALISSFLVIAGVTTLFGWRSATPEPIPL